MKTIDLLAEPLHLPDGSIVFELEIGKLIQEVWERMQYDGASIEECSAVSRGWMRNKIQRLYPGYKVMAFEELKMEDMRMVGNGYVLKPGMYFKIRPLTEEEKASNRDIFWELELNFELERLGSDYTQQKLLK